LRIMAEQLKEQKQKPAKRKVSQKTEN
jgi:hypothetical protein